MDYEQLADEFLMCSAAFMRNPLHRESETTSRGEFGVLGYLAFIQDGVTPGKLDEQFCVGSGRVADTRNWLSL